MSLTRLFAASALLLLACRARAANEQMFPAHINPTAVSAYLIKPSEGITKDPPTGWTLEKKANYSNSALAGENFSAAGKAEPLTTTSYLLPEADYEISILSAGAGRARIKGNPDWVDAPIGPKDGIYHWTTLGTVKNAKSVTVEVEPSGKPVFRYAGLVAEGSKMPVIPVANVLAKLKAGKDPVTICLIGDSVTENAKGFRGGSTNFDTGNPGLFKKYLEENFHFPVSYISHREPPEWPDDGDINKTKKVTIEGKELRDGRVEYDPSKKIRLINFGKGGAASPDAWHRLPDSFTEPGEWRLKGKSWVDTDDDTLPPILRNGVAHFKPALVTINFGTNDANGAHGGWTAPQYLFHMKVLATMIQHDLGAAVIVATPHLWTRGTHLNPNTQPDFADAIRTWSKASGIALADIYNEYPAGEYDGIHPGDAGHKHIADAYLKALLGQPSEPKITAQITAKDLKDNGDGTVTDAKHNLIWTKDANLAKGQKTPEEAAALITALNAEKKFGHDDWRLPTRDELLALLDPANRPALPKDHPFTSVAAVYLTATPNWTVNLAQGQPANPNSPKLLEGSIWPVRTVK